MLKYKYFSPTLNKLKQTYNNFNTPTTKFLMAPHKINNPNQIFIIIMIIVTLSLLLSPSIVFAKSHRPVSETEIRHKKNECYADIESGMWGWQCKSSTIAKENCVLQCLSPPCYELVYESDPLEEGEKDFVRSQEYKYCMHRLSVGESIEGVKGSFDY